MPKKETKIFAAILLLVSILSAGLFIYLFVYTKNLIAESANKESDIKLELKKEDVRVLMKEDLVSSKLYQEKLMDYMIPSGGTVDFIKILEQLVLNTGLKSDIKNVSSEPYDKGNAIGAELLRVNMDVIGEWQNIQFFITSLENYPLKIDIKKIYLNKFSEYTVKGRKVPQWSGSLEFTVVKVKDTK